MRRSLGLVLVGLGVLMLVLAPLVRWYAYPQLAVAPNDVTERVSTGAGVTVLDLGAVVRQEAQVERVTDVRSVRRIIPDQGESGDDVAVWDTSVTNFDALGAGATPEENVLSYFEERVAFDRHTAEAVDGRDQYYTPTGERADRVEVDHEGYYFKLPFGTERRSYPFWDSTIQDTRPMEFQNETTLEGLPVLVFEQVVEPMPVSALEIPGALFGQPGSIVADRVYSATRTIWVEPRTGAIIKGQEVQDSYLDFEGTRGPTIVQGTVAYTPEQVTANVDEFAGSARTLELARDTVPVAAAAAGAVFVILGLVLARRGAYQGKRRAPWPDDDSGGGVVPAGAAVVARPAADRAPARPAARPRVGEPAAYAERAQTRYADVARAGQNAPQQYPRQPSADEVRAEPALPRRPQPAAVRPPVGRPHVQPLAGQPQPQAASDSAALATTDLARLERVRAELDRFAQEHPELAGTGRAAAPAAAPDAPSPAAGGARAAESAAADEPAAPAPSGRRRARADDGLFDEFDDDGQSAGSLHRY